MPFNRTALIDLLHTMRDLQLGLYVQIDESEQNRAGTLENWSAKDLLVHNAEWLLRHQSELEVIERGDSRPKYGYEGGEDALNAANHAIFEQYRTLSWDTVHGFLRDAYARVDAYLARNDDAALLTTPEGMNRPNWAAIAGYAITHPMIHLWEHYQQQGAQDRITAQFGPDFIEKQLAISDDAVWHGMVNYNLACALTSSGQTDAALERLAEALRLYPAITEWSQQDSDLAPLRDLPGYAALYE